MRNEKCGEIGKGKVAHKTGEDNSAWQARSTSRRGSFVNKHTGSLNEFELTIGSVDRDFEHGDIFQSNYVGIEVTDTSSKCLLKNVQNQLRPKYQN